MSDDTPPPAHGKNAAEADLLAELTAAEARVSELRAENSALAEQFRAEPTDEGREGLKRAAASLATARDRVDAARAALEVFRRTGSRHGLVAEHGHVGGTIAGAVAAGASREQRARASADGRGEERARAAAELGAALGAAPDRYTRERPGRDAEGRTVLDVAGRVEGDVLLPAISRAAKSAAR